MTWEMIKVIFLELLLSTCKCILTRGNPSGSTALLIIQSSLKKALMLAWVRYPDNPVRNRSVACDQAVCNSQVSWLWNSVGMTCKRTTVLCKVTQPCTHTVLCMHSVNFSEAENTIRTWRTTQPFREYLSLLISSSQMNIIQTLSQHPCAGVIFLISV